MGRLPPPLFALLILCLLCGAEAPETAAQGPIQHRGRTWAPPPLQSCCQSVPLFCCPCAHWYSTDVPVLWLVLSALHSHKNRHLESQENVFTANQLSTLARCCPCCKSAIHACALLSLPQRTWRLPSSYRSATSSLPAGWL